MPPLPLLVEFRYVLSMGHLLGYARVSTTDQDASLQIDALGAAGCYRVFVDTMSGSLQHRPELDKLLDQLRPGDMARAERRLFAVEVAQQLQQFGGFHEFCFSLQVMQTRVQGIAFSRGAAISSPQSRQIP